MCLGGSAPNPTVQDVYVPPELEEYKYKIADIQIGGDLELKKKKKQVQQNTVINRKSSSSNDDISI